MNCAPPRRTQNGSEIYYPSAAPAGSLKSLGYKEETSLKPNALPAKCLPCPSSRRYGKTSSRPWSRGLRSFSAESAVDLASVSNGNDQDPKAPLNIANDSVITDAVSPKFAQCRALERVTHERGRRAGYAFAKKTVMRRAIGLSSWKVLLRGVIEPQSTRPSSRSTSSRNAFGCDLPSVPQDASRPR